MNILYSGPRVAVPLFGLNSVGEAIFSLGITWLWNTFIHPSILPSILLQHSLLQLARYQGSGPGLSILYCWILRLDRTLDYGLLAPTYHTLLLPPLFQSLFGYPLLRKSMHTYIL